MILKYRTYGLSLMLMNLLRSEISWVSIANLFEHVAVKTTAVSIFATIFFFFTQPPSPKVHHATCATSLKCQMHRSSDFSYQRMTTWYWGQNQYHLKTTDIHEIKQYETSWHHLYGYFRLIRARTERFDLRYDSGVWFGGMIRGMIRGYDSRRRKPSYQHWPGLEPWA